MVPFSTFPSAIVVETFRRRGAAPAATVLVGEVGRFRDAGP